MSDLTLSEAALLAGLPQSPSSLDPYRSAYSKSVKRKGKTHIVVQTCKYGANLKPVDPDCVVTAPIVRRDFILRALLDGLRQVDPADQGAGPRGPQPAHRPVPGTSPTTTWRPTSWSP